jgi:hypothetical protein
MSVIVIFPVLNGLRKVIGLLQAGGVELSA